MAFFRTINFSEPLPSIVGEGVMLRTPQMTDYSDWAALRERSREFLTPWEPTWPADDLTRSAFRRRIRRYAEDLRTDQGYAFLIVRNSDGAIVGGLTLANIRRGVAQAGSLGYWMGLPFVRRGYMTAAVRAVIPFAFSTLRLHRLEAACIPDQCRLDPPSGKHRLRARGLCARISVHQRHLAGPSALWPVARCKAVTEPTGVSGVAGEKRALGWPRFVCYSLSVSARIWRLRFGGMLGNPTDLMSWRDRMLGRGCAVACGRSPAACSAGRIAAPDAAGCAAKPSFQGAVGFFPEFVGRSRRSRSPARTRTSIARPSKSARAPPRWPSAPRRQRGDVAEISGHLCARRARMFGCRQHMVMKVGVRGPHRPRAGRRSRAGPCPAADRRGRGSAGGIQDRSSPS